MPPLMDWEATNLPEAWEKFERHARLMFEGPHKGTNAKEQVAYTLFRVGDRERIIHASWTDITQEQTRRPNYILQRFKEFVSPKSNPIFARYTFYNETQREESIYAFLARLTLISKDCDFGDKSDEMIRDRIVYGCKSEGVREKLIDKGKALTLEISIQIAQSYQYNKNN